MSSIHIPVGYEVNADQFYSATEKIHIYPNFHKWKWWGRIFTRVTWRSSQMISSSMTTCLTLTCYPNLFTRVPYTFGYTPVTIAGFRLRYCRKMWRQLKWIWARPSKISPNCAGTLNGFTHVDWKTELIFGASFDFKCSWTNF